MCEYGKCLAAYEEMKAFVEEFHVLTQNHGSNGKPGHDLTPKDFFIAGWSRWGCSRCSRQGVVPYAFSYTQACRKSNVSARESRHMLLAIFELNSAVFRSRDSCTGQRFREHAAISSDTAKPCKEINVQSARNLVLADLTI